MRTQNRNQSKTIPAMSMPPTLYILAGPTAVGKTALALQWAETHDAEILSCDAYCVYQGMDIGAAKPTPQEQARVPHHGIDQVPVSTVYSVAEYVDYARRVVERTRARGCRLLITGGSGFYLKSFFAPVVDGWEISPEVKAEVQKWKTEGGAARLLEALLRLNPEGIGNLDTQNPRRVQAALERCLASGRSVLQQQADFAAQKPPFADFRLHVCRLEREDADLKARIALRNQWMLDTGLIQEVESLKAQGIEENPSAATAIGYRETLAWLKEGSGDRAQLAAEIAHSAWQLVRKQRKWFRSQLPQHRLVHLQAQVSLDVDELFPTD